MPLLAQLAVFAVTLAALIALNRWITLEVQVIGYRLTGSERIALLVYYLLLLPGILLHELSHIAMALLLGLRVGKLEMGPKVRGRTVELGSVRVSRGGAVRDSLVGLAPFLVGTAVLLLVGQLIFPMAELGQAWQGGGWRALGPAFASIWQVPDLWLRAYIIFAASNAMTPSPADRQPWLAAGLYLVLALIAAYLLGGLPWLAEALGAHVAGAVQLLTLAFIFTLALDLLVAAVLWILEFVILALTGQGK